ncbi:MAG: methionyl-tRNA formyltransferase [Lachnospiraceae bacterium]|nr:methionyl-tRNA formyltransferase [Lachnospiraceae bacterium]
MRLIFMGTPDFAVGSLESLIAAGHEIALVVTQPDRAKGRSDKLVFSPVKECALRHGLEVFQPEKVKTPEAVEVLRGVAPDLIVVAAFGQILSKEILELPKYGCINVHASLLPKYRGASPIQHVILNGEERSGITIMEMNEGLDTGDILLQKELVLAADETFETLHDRLAELGGRAITEALEALEKGSLTARPQREDESCYAPLIRKSMGKLDFSRDAVSLDRQVRAMNPWPGAYTMYDGKMMKIYRVALSDVNTKAAPGTVLFVDRDSFTVACAQGSLKILELQMEGKKRMDCSAFLLGSSLEEGTVLGN